jgi:tRNA (guanine-N7-)-methyltransferase
VIQSDPPCGAELTALAAGVYFPVRDLISRLDFGALFPSRQPVEIDLGCGDGVFLIGEAIRRPHHNFIGIERQDARIRRSCRRAARSRLTNVRVLLIESAYFVRYLVAPGSVQTMHVMFPDPWPKRRHAFHRMLNSEFFEAAAVTLAPGGDLRFVTDDEPYFVEATQAASTCAVLEETDPEPDPERTHTSFEKIFRGASKTIHAARWRRPTTNDKT